MKFIAHRINTIEELAHIPTICGVEIDVRDYGDTLVLVHDPYVEGEHLGDFLKAYRHGTLIINVKSERIEHRIVDLLEVHGITDYFFLDSSFPMIYLLSNQGNTNCALRFSEFEGIDTLKQMAGKVQWVWVDCFTKIPLDKQTYDHIKELGYKTCFVSPELQGRQDDVALYIEALSQEGIHFDAVCAKIKNYSLWMEHAHEEVQ